MRKKLNRTERRYIQNLNKDKLQVWLDEYAVAMYNDGVRDAFMSLLLKLRDEFGFGNERIERLLKACEPWMDACMSGKEDIDNKAIKEQLIAEGIVCLLNTDL